MPDISSVIMNIDEIDEYIILYMPDIFLVIVDIDECRNSSYKCDQYANCINTVGSYNCSCKEGFTGDGLSCSGKFQH